MQPAAILSANSQYGIMGQENLWDRLLANIKGRISRNNFDIWFKQVRFLELNDDEIHLVVPSQGYATWLKDNYQEALVVELEKLTGKRIELVFHFESTSEPGSSTEVPSAGHETDPTLTGSGRQDRPEIAAEQFPLNPDKNFANFVVGSSNQFAHAAAVAVAENPARAYNPLFIFGTVGIGKTHLLNAVGNRILQDQPEARVIYLSAEQFMNEMINSLRDDRMIEFRNKYRKNCDALLVDDIQFLAGKLRTQEEFFYTFNELHSSGRQIVVSADKYPREITGMEERLRNRFEWGLIADIQPPDLETRVAILKKKALADQLPLPDDVALYVATHTRGNVRELEGNLTRLSAAASFLKRPIDLTFARKTLDKLFNEPKAQITISTIQEATANHFNLKLPDLKGSRRQQQLVFPRQLAMYLCRQLTDHSFPEIGQQFNGRDHTTVIHAVRKIEKCLEEEAETQLILESIKRALGI